MGEPRLVPDRLVPLEWRDHGQAFEVRLDPPLAIAPGERVTVSPSLPFAVIEDEASSPSPPTI